MTLPNMWKFPGGKVEEDESLFQAIEGEIKEKLDCDKKALEVFNDNTHDYGNFVVNLIAIKSNLVSGIPVAGEHSKLIWLKIKNLDSLKWSPTDVPAVSQLSKECNKK